MGHEQAKGLREDKPKIKFYLFKSGFILQMQNFLFLEREVSLFNNKKKDFFFFLSF